MSLPGLRRVLAWPAWPVPGLKITACACHRQAGTGRPNGLFYPLVDNQKRISNKINIEIDNDRGR